MNKLFLYCLTGLLLCSTGWAEIYKWTDEKGRVHFSDSKQGQQNAETVTIKINSYEHVSYGDLSYDSGKKVKLFYADWCGFCKKAKRYFRAKGIPFEVLDIEKSRAAKREFDALGGTGIPLILVGKKRMQGFTEQGFERLYNSI